MPQAAAWACTTWPERTRCRKHCSSTRCWRSVSAAVSLTSSEGPCRFSAECATYPRLLLPPPALSALEEAADGALGLWPSPPPTPPAPPRGGPCANVQRAPLRHLPCAKYLHGRMPGLAPAAPLGSLLPRWRHEDEASADASPLSSFFCFFRPLSAEACPSWGGLPAPHCALSTVCRRVSPTAAPCPAASPLLLRSVGAALGCPGCAVCALVCQRGEKNLRVPVDGGVSTSGSLTHQRTHRTRRLACQRDTHQRTRGTPAGVCHSGGAAPESGAGVSRPLRAMPRAPASPARTIQRSCCRSRQACFSTPTQTHSGI